MQKHVRLLKHRRTISQLIKDAVYKLFPAALQSGVNDSFSIVIQERERKERFEEAVRQKELKKAEMAQKLVLICIFYLPRH